MTYVLLLAIGLVAGLFSGMLGIGGGLIIVPALLFLVKMKPLEATGTSLAALIPPVGLLGALEYYKEGLVRIPYASLIAGGLFVGAYFGARLISHVPAELVQRSYAVLLILVAIRMLVTR